MPDGSTLAGRFPVTFFPDQTAADKRQLFCTLEELAHNLGMARGADKASLPWIKLCLFGDLRTENYCLRHDGNVLAISGVEGDYDGGPTTFDEAVELLKYARVRGIVYSTPSDCAAKPHWRVLCPLSAPVYGTPVDLRQRRAALMDRLNGIFGGGLAPESWVLSQSYYFGSVDGGSSMRAQVVYG